MCVTKICLLELFFDDLNYLINKNSLKIIYSHAIYDIILDLNSMYSHTVVILYGSECFRIVSLSEVYSE